MPPKNHYKKAAASTEVVDTARLQPQAIELEEAVLGGMMLENEQVHIIMGILTERSFYHPHHSTIFRAISILYGGSYPIDILTVTQELKKMNKLDEVGGAFYITQMTNRVASAAHMEFHARIVAQKFIQRELIRIGNETARDAYTEGADIFKLISDFEIKMTDLTRTIRTGAKAKSLSKLWNEMVEKNKKLLEAAGINGIPCGYTAIDRTTGGWQDGDLIILAARPAMGKTALALNMAVNASVRFGKAGVFFSLEMSALQLFTRMVSLETDVSNNRFNRHGIPEEELFEIGERCTKLMHSNLTIDDTPALNIIELKSKARKYARDEKIDFIMVDYLQLMDGDGNESNRERVIAGISRGLKVLAKELGIPVIALSQLSRATEQRKGDKRPQLSDLRESGAIEQDADIVMFLHRPEYYGITEDEEGMSTLGVSEVDFAKHRNGPVGVQYLKFLNTLTKFVDADARERDVIQPTAKHTPHADSLITGKNKANDIEEDYPF